MSLKLNSALKLSKTSELEAEQREMVKVTKESLFVQGHEQSHSYFQFPLPYVSFTELRKLSKIFRLKL